MKIGLNATCFSDRPSGAKQRFIGLYGSLFTQMPEAEFVVFEPCDTKLDTWFNNHDNVTFIQTVIPSEGRVKKFLLGLNFWKKFLKNEKIDYFEGFNLPSIQNPTGKTFHTIHDVRGIYKEFSTWEHIISKPAHIRSLRRVDSIITVSETMKAEILKLCPDADISVIYNGLNHKNFANVQQDTVDKIKKELNLPSEFILSVGHFEHRKNYLNLIDAVNILKKLKFKIPLVIVGNDNGTKKIIDKKISQENLSDLVHIHSNLTDAEVQVLYKTCNLFIFPSTYEGFGIPILESMAMNTPIILSDLKVFKEITQNKGIYFNPHDPNDIAKCIKETLMDEDLLNDMKHYGLTRVKDFDFFNLALKLKKFYLSRK